MTKSCLSVILLVLLTSISVASAMTGAPQADAILKKVDAIRLTQEPMILDAIVTNYTSNSVEGEKRVMEIRTKGSDRSLVRHSFPPRLKGQSILMVKDNLWIFIKGTRQPIRIAPRQRLVGQVSIGDIARLTFAEAYETTNIERTSLNEVNCFKLSLKAKTKKTAYAQADLWVAEDNFRPLQCDFFVLSGKLLKRVYFDKYREYLGIKRPTVLKIVDAIKQDEYSLIEYTDMRAEDTPDIYFKKNHMKNLK